MKITNLTSCPLVSVVIPTYKCSGLICRAIDSVTTQTYPNIEIIVVDDNGEGSQNQKQTETFLSQYIERGQIKYIKHPVNRNGSAARNTGLNASRGVFINFLDDDDYFLPEKIEKQIESLLSSDTTYDASYCNMRYVVQKTKISNKEITEYTSKYKGNILAKYLMGEIIFNTSALLFRRKVLEDLKGFDESYLRHQDWELLIRFFRNHNITCPSSSSPLAVFDISERSRTPNMELIYPFSIRLLSEFKSDLQKVGIQRQFTHRLLSEYVTYFLDHRKYSSAFDAFKRIFQTGKISIRQYLSIIKHLILSFN